MFSNKIYLHYIYAILIGIMVGFKIIPPFVVGTIFVVLLISFFIFIQKADLQKAFIVLPFIIFSEIYIRSQVRTIPYLSVQYTIIFALLGSVLTARNKKFHFVPIIIFILFYLLEFTNGLSPLNKNFTNAILWQSFSLLVAALWASQNQLSAEVINKTMDSIKIAANFLLGIVLVAHLQGKIDYETASNTDASGGLAPVQLSGYLGTAAFLMIISIMNTFDKRSKIIQLLFFVLCITLMVLTFSRGGVYFVGITLMIYMFFNRTNLGNYFKFLILLPIGILIFNFVVDTTGGKVIDRYKAKGASNREELVAIGFFIYSKYPVLGIGTGNYNTYIKRNNLFSTESGVHNEFVRAAAEHGTFGILFYWGFFIALLIEIFRRPKPFLEFSLYFFILFFLINIHNGLKISIQPFLLMLAISIAPPTKVPIGQQRNIKNVIPNKFQPA